MNRCKVQTGWAVSAFSLCAVLAVGCGGSSVDGRYPVRGRVTLDGTPLGLAAIAFYEVKEAEAGQKALGVGAAIKDGEYQMDAERGLVPGNYVVKIYWGKKTGKKIPIKDDPPNEMDETVEGLSAEYNTKSKLTATIEPKANVIDFELKSSSGKATP